MKRLAANAAGYLCMAAMYALLLFCLLSPQPGMRVPFTAPAVAEPTPSPVAAAGASFPQPEQPE